jgi:cytidylate kinase
MIDIITVEREYGSGSAAIAEKLAARLGWKLWDQSLTHEVAKLAGVDPKFIERRKERPDSLLHRLAKVFMRGSFERRVPMEGFDTFDADSMVALFQQVIERAASTPNCVLVGRGSPYFLRHRVDVCHIFIYAPREEKLRRLLLIGKSKAEAEELLDVIDRERALFVKKYFKKEWPCQSLYHLMINSKIGDEAVIELILHCIDRLNAQCLLRSATAQERTSSG